MMLLLDLDTTRFLQQYRIRSVSVFYEFIKHSTIPEVKSKIYVHANMFGIINVLGVFQDEQMKIIAL